MRSIRTLMGMLPSPSLLPLALAKPQPNCFPPASAVVTTTAPGECSCGRTISLNKRYCLACIERLEYVSLVMARARGEQPKSGWVRYAELHERFGTVDHREQTISFAYGNVAMHNPKITREMVAAQFDKLFPPAELHRADDDGMAHG